MVDISAALTSIKTISGIAIAGGKIELTQNVIELQQTLLSLQAENAELSEANRDLRKKIQELIDLSALSEEFYFDRNAYYKGEGSERDGPFCSRCFDAEGKAIRLTQNQPKVGTCHNCKNAVRLDGPAVQAVRTTVRRRPDWVNGWRR
jgi:hypothetical protein